MIRALRTRHRIYSYLLLVLLPPLFLLGISGRQSIPTMEKLPPALERLPAPADMRIINSSNNLWDGQALTSYIFKSMNAGEDRGLLILFPDHALDSPDLLLYWQPAVESERQLSDQALLLGSVSMRFGGRYDLPRQVWTQPGALMLYSLAHNQLVASTAFPDESVAANDKTGSPGSPVKEIR